MDGRGKVERGRHGGGSRTLRAHNLNLKPKAEKANWKQMRPLTFISHPLNLPKQHHQWRLVFKYPKNMEGRSSFRPLQRRREGDIRRTACENCE